MPLSDCTAGQEGHKKTNSFLFKSLGVKVGNMLDVLKNQSHCIALGHSLVFGVNTIAIEANKIVLKGFPS